MEVSALKYSGGVGLHGRSALLRLQSDERLISLLRRGNTTAFEVLLARYESRLMAFCRHLLGSREDAEDVLQEVMTAAFNAILADDRPINVRPWLYRIARNRSLNHLRRAQAIGVDSMDHHLAEHGATTADKVHEREEFRLLVGDIHELPETQKTALVLREMDALSYEQIAEAMETTVPSRQVAAGTRAGFAGRGRRGPPAVLRPGPDRARRDRRRAPAPAHPARAPPPAQLQALQHVPDRAQEDQPRARRAAAGRADGDVPQGPLPASGPLGRLGLDRLGHRRRLQRGRRGRRRRGRRGGAAGAGAAGAGAAVAGTTAVAGGAAAGSSGLVSAGIGALAGKAAAGLAAAALVTAGAVEAGHSTHRHLLHKATVAAVPASSSAPAQHASVSAAPSPSPSARAYSEPRSSVHGNAAATKDAKKTAKVTKADQDRPKTTATDPTTTTPTTTTDPTTVAAKPPVTGRTQTQSDPTVLPSAPTTVATTPTPAADTPPATTTTTDDHHDDADHGHDHHADDNHHHDDADHGHDHHAHDDRPARRRRPRRRPPPRPRRQSQTQTQTSPESSTTPSSTGSDPHTLAFFRTRMHRWWGRESLALAHR